MVGVDGAPDTGRWGRAGEWGWGRADGGVACRLGWRSPKLRPGPFPARAMARLTLSDGALSSSRIPLVPRPLPPHALIRNPDFTAELNKMPDKIQQSNQWRKARAKIARFIWNSALFAREKEHGRTGEIARSSCPRLVGAPAGCIGEK
jgi:hypothetical protein